LAFTYIKVGSVRRYNAAYIWVTTAFIVVAAVFTIVLKKVAALIPKATHLEAHIALERISTLLEVPDDNASS